MTLDNQSFAPFGDVSFVISGQLSRPQSCFFCVFIVCCICLSIEAVGGGVWWWRSFSAQARACTIFARRSVASVGRGDSISYAIVLPTRRPLRPKTTTEITIKARWGYSHPVSQSVARRKLFRFKNGAHWVLGVRYLSGVG